MRVRIITNNVDSSAHSLTSTSCTSGWKLLNSTTILCLDLVRSPNNCGKYEYYIGLPTKQIAFHSRVVDCLKQSRRKILTISDWNCIAFLSCYTFFLLLPFQLFYFSSFFPISSKSYLLKFL